jgi:hypothetical protein
MSRLNNSDVKTKYEGLNSLERVLGFCIERQRDRDRETDRETERQTDRQTDMLTN